MPKRKRGDDFGLNFQTGKGRDAEIQTNFYVVVLIETTANELRLSYFTIRRDDELARYDCFELQSAATELDLRHNSVVIVVEFDKLGRVPDRERQCCLQH